MREVNPAAGGWAGSPSAAEDGFWRSAVKHWFGRGFLMSVLPALQRGINNSCISIFSTQNPQVLFTTNSQITELPFPLLFSSLSLSLFFLPFSFLFKPPPFPFESVNERMSKAREVWKDFIPREVRVGWKVEGAARGAVGKQETMWQCACRAQLM